MKSIQKLYLVREIEHFVTLWVSIDLNFVFFNGCFFFAGEENHEVEEAKLEADFEAYKAKVYSLTVPLKLVALRGSVPPSWIKVLFHFSVFHFYLNLSL